jgi:hypothetical protein
MHVGPVLIFEQALDQFVFVFFNAYFLRSTCFADVTSATITWDIVNTAMSAGHL